MPPPNLMLLQNKSGNPSAWWLINGLTVDPTKDGIDFPGASTESFPANQNEVSTNRMIEAFGKRFALIDGDIRERNEGGDGNWGVVHTLNNAEASRRGVSGLHLMHPGGVPTLVVMYGYTSNRDLRAATSTDGVTWNTYTSPNTGATNAMAEYSRSAVFGEELYWAQNWEGGAGDRAFITAFNTRTNTWTFYFLDALMPGSIEQNVSYIDFLVHKGKLYFCTRDDSNHGYLFRLDGSVWTNVLGGGLPGNPFWSSNWGIFGISPALINDGNDIIFLATAGFSQVQAFRFENPEGLATVTNVTSPIWDNVNNNTTGHMTKYLDTSDPNNPTWYIWHGAGGGQINFGSFELYQYNPMVTDLQPMTFLGVGPSATIYSLPHVGDGGGERIPVAPSARAEFDGVAEGAIGGRRRFFRVHGFGSDLTLQQAHNIDQEGPNTVSTLVTSTIQLEDPINTTGLVGNLGELALEGLTPSAGDAYLVSAVDGDGTLNPGGILISKGDFVQYTGSNWILVESRALYESSLKAYYKFNSGNFLDATENSYDLNETGTINHVPGIIGEAADFPGANGNYLSRSVDDNALDIGLSGAPWAVAFWLNVDSIASGWIINKTNGTSNGWTMFVEAGSTGRLQYSTAGLSLISTAPGIISVGAGWQHCVVTSDGSTTKIYVDGVERASGATVNPANSAAGLRIGNRAQNDFPLNGQLDEVTIWSRWLSPAEISVLYNGGSGYELGLPLFGFHAELSTATPLIAPYADGIDNGLIVSFDGTSLEGTVLSTPTNSTSQIIVTPDNGVSLWSYVHDIQGDFLSPGDKHTVILDPV